MCVCYIQYKDAVIQDLYDQHVFRASVKYIHTIEYQKHSLPTCAFYYF
jgi:hypothetical protein